MCVTVGVGFEVSYAQAKPSVAHSLLLPVDQDEEPSAPSLALCLYGAMFPTMIMHETPTTVIQPQLNFPL